jgi:3,4-dihydroxy 2-butanone 4-phosphate synthase/GTP cyclohydrolase II
MSPIPAFLSQFSHSRLGILVDDIGSERAALVAPAQNISADEVNRVLSLGGGLPFVALSPGRANAFMLSSMVNPSAACSPTPSNTAGFSLLTSVEAREGITTGISAADRATTIRILGAREPHPRDLVKPGHIFPTEVREGGVLVKSAIPEGSLDLVRLAGFSDAALFVDLLGKDGEILRLREAQSLAASESLPIASLSELIAHRLHREPLVERVADAAIPSRFADGIRGIVYRSKIHDVEHIALVKGDVSHGGPVLVRVQPEQTVSDVFGGGPLSSRGIVHASLHAIESRGAGVLLYLRRPFIDEKHGSTQSLSGEHAVTRSPTMMREYGVGAQILRDLGISQIELLSSTPRSMTGLESFGITIVSQHPIPEVELRESFT